MPPAIQAFWDNLFTTPDIRVQASDNSRGSAYQRLEGADKLMIGPKSTPGHGGYFVESAVHCTVSAPHKCILQLCCWLRIDGRRLIFTSRLDARVSVVRTVLVSRAFGPATRQTQDDDARSTSTNGTRSPSKVAA